MNFLDKLGSVGGAIRRRSDLEEVVNHPNIGVIFLLGGDINYLPSMVKRVKAADKMILLHLDLFEGVGKDKPGIRLLKRLGVDGIVTTKANLAKYALEDGLIVIQRFFIVDSESIKTAIKVADSVKPTAIEILPATVPQYVIEEMKTALGLPVLGGGLLKTKADVEEALAKGVDAISTSLRQLWNKE